VAEHGICAETVVADLGNPLGVEQLARVVIDAGLQIEALVNNAGIGIHGAFADNDAAAQLTLLQLNIVSLTQLTRLLLPGMLARGAGRILNVASTAGFVPGPFMAVYYASKADVLSLSVALANELAGTGVTVTALYPGATRTRLRLRTTTRRA
jgi:short-subunit dehydrogenase